MFRKITAFIFIVVLSLSCATPIPQFTAADLPIVDGKIYHLSITAEHLASNIIIIGDPDRAPFLADHCLQQEGRKEVFHRGLRTITGTTTTGMPLSIITTGMGTASAEIVLNEIVILNEIDLATRTRRAKPLHNTMNIIRLGTSGALQSATELGTLIITEYAVGMDNTGLFYTTDNADENVLRLEKLCKEKIDAAFNKNSRFYQQIYPYASAASPEVVQALEQAAQEEHVKAIRGITVSNAGFFANQGRDVSRLHLSIPDIDQVLSTVSINNLKVENMEMEASFVCHFLGALGYRVGTMCPVVCNRMLNTFYDHYESKVLEGLKVVLKAFEKLNNKH